MPVSAEHWDEAYRQRGPDGVSWAQAVPAVSVELVQLLRVDKSVPVVDVGGGSSSFAAQLVGQGFGDVSVLDISEVALSSSRDGVRPGAPVTWLHQDVLSWSPARSYGLWHDRAVFHFLVRPEDRARYLAVLASALAPGGAVVLATFAEDGPEHCSGLPVQRYSSDALLSELGHRYVPVAVRRELHTTPTGVVQPFTWVAARAS